MAYRPRCCARPGDQRGRFRILSRPQTAHSYRDGVKTHIPAGPETVLTTAVDLTPGNPGDGDAAMKLLDGERAGTKVLAYSAYDIGTLRACLRDAVMTAVIKPSPLRRAVQNGCSVGSLDIDAQATTAMWHHRHVSARHGPLLPRTRASTSSLGIVLHHGARTLANGERFARRQTSLRIPQELTS